MFELSRPEIVIFTFVVVAYLAAATVGILQLRPDGGKYKRLLPPLVSLAVTTEAVILIFRAAAIKAVPLTGLFESMIVLTIVFGLIYLFFNIFISQVWFSSVMIWVILAMILMAATVAEPASRPHAAAATPWAIAHGVAMILGGASITFATASAFLYLLGRRKLKQKKVMQVLGRVPNMEKLKSLNVFGLKACFVLMTVGLVSGFGLAIVKSTAMQMSILDWLIDPKIVLIIAAWILLAVILMLHHLVVLKDKTTAYITMAVCFLILFAIIGTVVFCGTKHDFAKGNIKIVEVWK